MDWKNQLWRIICNYWIAQDISELLHLFKSKYQILRFFNNLGFAKTEPKIRIIEWSVLLLLCSSTMSKLRKTFLFLKHKCAYLFWVGFNCLKVTESLRGDSLIFTTQSQEILALIQSTSKGWKAIVP